MTLALNDTNQNQVKDPDADLDFQWDWTRWLSTGETITGTPTVTVTPATTPAMTTHSVVALNGVVQAWLAGGMRGQTYRVTCEITTNQGRIDDRSFIVAVENR